MRLGSGPCVAEKRETLAEPAAPLSQLRNQLGMFDRLVDREWWRTILRTLNANVRMRRCSTHDISKRQHPITIAEGFPAHQQRRRDEDGMMG